MKGIKKIFLGLLFSLIVFLTGLELTLRLAPSKLPPQLGNDLVRTYTTSVGGIYVFDLDTRCNFFLPNHTHHALFNGHQWLHQTDQRRFRNPPGVGTEVVLLGDSYVYGHGVEEEQTLAAVLRRDFGWQAYNMGRQGDSLPQEYTVFKLNYQELKPKKVLLFPIVNDFGDIAVVFKDEELSKPAALDYDMDALRQRLKNPQLTRQVGNWIDWSYTYRLVESYLNTVKARGGPPPGQRYQSALDDPKLKAVIGRYYEALFVDMLRLCREIGAELEVVYLYVEVPNEGWMHSQKVLHEYLSDLCRRHKVPYLNTYELFKGHPELVLPNDYHLSPAGHQAVARWLVERQTSKR